MYGRVPASADEVVASGLLKREELAHAGGERIDWQPGRGARSSWGAVGGLTPLIDLPAPAKVTPSEKAAYEMFVSGYQSFWRTNIDPVAIRIELAPDGRGPLSADVRVLPIIGGTDYADMLRTVGRARVDLGDGGSGGLRTAIGIGADAEIRQLLTRSLREMPLVGSLKVDWMGDWAMVGMDDTATPAAREAMRNEATAAACRTDRSRDLVDLPVYAGIEVRNMTAAVAFLATARHASSRRRRERSDWGEAGRERDVPFVAVRAGSARRRGDRGRRALLRVLQERARAVAQRVGAAAPHRRLPRRHSSRAARSAAGAEGPQWIFDLDMRERGPLWWRLALLAASGQLDGERALGAGRRRGGAAWRARRVAVGRRLLARDTLGAIPVTPEGYAYALAEDGLHDPLRGVRRAATSWASSICSPARSRRSCASGVSSRARAARWRSTTSRRRRPAGRQPARSLHVKLRLEPDRGAPSSGGAASTPEFTARGNRERGSARTWQRRRCGSRTPCSRDPPTTSGRRAGARRA